jgi:hypothetical protein
LFKRGKKKAKKKYDEKKTSFHPKRLLCLKQKKRNL